MSQFVFCKKLKEMYGDSCKEFAVAELEQTTLYFFPYFPVLLLGASCIIFLKNNTNILYELLYQVGYRSFLVATKIHTTCNKIKNIFVSSKSDTILNKKKYIYDEVKVIKNGLRCASFETMKTFKDSNYLGNPNEYYDLDENIEDLNSSSSFDSDEVTNSPSSTSDYSSENSESSEPERLYIIEKNEHEKIAEFKNFDFIMHTNYKYSETTEITKQNYTKIYRTFTNYDYDADKNKYQVSHAEIIICIMKLDGEDTEYEIDLSTPYNFNVVGNIILDEKFVHWYIFKVYNYKIEPSINYKITCITNCNKHEVDRSCGLYVNLNDYKVINKKLIYPYVLNNLSINRLLP
jgi:hypothetical protein